MTITKTVSGAILCLGLMTITNACSNDHKDSEETAKDMNDAKFSNEEEKDANKLVDACASNLYEIKASENTEMNAMTPEVRKLAFMLAAAHIKMNEGVKELAGRKSVSLPTELTEEQKKQLEKLSEKTGMDYDKSYTEQMKDKHEHAIKFYEKIVNNCKDEDIKLWAEKMVSEVRAHLDMVMSSYNIVKDMK